MLKLTALAMVTMAFASAVVADSKCTAGAPCYREGWCDNGPMFCMYSLCDPSKSFNSTSCWKPEGCTSQETQFDKSSDAVAIKQYKGNPNDNSFVSIFEPNNANVENGNLVLKMTLPKGKKQGFGATVDSTHTIHYGRVTARVKTASVAKGVVTAFIIRNDQIGDELDFEWVGKDPSQVQVNYFYHDILDYGNSKRIDVGADTSADYHDYTIDWSEDSVKWIVDGKTVHTLNRKDTYDSKKKVYKYPSAEGRVGLSIWDGGNAPGKGTQEWAGYPTPWNKDTVYRAYFDSIKIECSGKDIATSKPDPDTTDPSSDDTSKPSDDTTSDDKPTDDTSKPNGDPTSKPDEEGDPTTTPDGNPTDTPPQKCHIVYKTVTA